jgi:hypothetical protein
MMAVESKTRNDRWPKTCLVRLQVAERAEHLRNWEKTKDRLEREAMERKSA